MKITGVNVYQVDLPLIDGGYAWSGGKAVSSFDSTVIEILTDSGIKGYGEACPIGCNYLPSYPEGVRTGLKELVPHLIGIDPLELGHLNHVMDYQLKGHPYVKSGIDVACWDILGKFCKLPVCTLLGGRFGDSVHLYRSITNQPLEQMKETVLKYHKEGYRRIQLKLSGKPDDDIECFHVMRAALPPDVVVVGDANTGWLPHEALRVAAAVKDLDVYIEQPCATYEECLTVRSHTNRPFILDENMDDVKLLPRIIRDHAADVVNLKISKLGGLTKAKQARDLCVTFGIAMTLEDTWGSDIATAAISHFAHSTPEKFRFTCTDFNSYCTVHIADGGPLRIDGKMAASMEPGLGVTPIMDVLGKPIMSF